MKSNRRKQTNPNRVAAGTHDLNSTVLPVLADELTNQEEGVQEETDEMDVNSSSPSPPINGRQSTDLELPLDMHVSVSTCSHYSPTFPDQKELQGHKVELQAPEFKKPRLDTMGEDFPTAYHRLGRELQESTDLPLVNGHLENKMSPSLPRADSTPSPKDTSHSLALKLPTSIKSENEFMYSEHPHLQLHLAPKSLKESNGEPMNGKTDRIFHIDAYCELCDREFCNKYFLKTHKANKHGIYEDSSPPASNVTLPFPGLMIPQDPLASFNFKMDSMKPQLVEPLLPWSFKLDSPAPQIMKSENSSCPKPIDHPLPLFSMPHLESPKPAMNKNSSGNSNGGVHSASSGCLSSTSISATSILPNITNNIKNGSSPSTAAPPSNDASMEDYCHICQKHFCNKYYLRKHKQDVHGIVPDNLPSNCSKRSRSGLLDLPMTSSNPMMLPQSLASLAGMHSLSGMPGLSSISSMSNMPPGVMVINPYSLPPVAIIPAGSLMPGQQIHPSQHPIISQPMGITSMSEPSLHHPILSTSVVSSSANSLGHSPIKTSPTSYEGGVHCNICSKEFCNDFYLQIHKESKHGIRRGSEELSRDKALSLVKEKKHDSASPSPLSHIAKNELFPMLPRSPIDRATIDSAESNNILICNFCNKDFSNKYLYRIHRIHEHGLNELFDPMLAENGELPHREHAMNSFNESLMRMAADASAVGYASSFRTSPSSKHQESVTCDICNKQIANHHFLRLHKFNVHGKDPSSSERYDSKPDNYSTLPISKPKTPPSSGSLSISSPSQQHMSLPQLPPKPHMLPFLPPKIDFKDMPPFPDFNRDFKNFRDMPSFLADTINSELFARSQNQAMHMDLNFFGLPSLGKLPIDDNVKLNFDPEAYCEICKKEFCSKYFLRTHKQNIHGIKSETTSSSSSKSSDSDMANTVPSQKPNLNSINGKPSDIMDKNSWRWKEPVNSSRVICDICNKEVCNKYFLRTHKQKKHGKTPTSQSPNISMSGSPVACDCDTASNASSQPDEKPFKLDPGTLPQIIPLPATEKVSEKLHINALDFGNNNKDISLNNNTEPSETCNICYRRFKNLKWLKDHIIKDHSDNEALDMSSKNCPSSYTCQVCGTDFPAELSVQLHLIQEHNARVTLDTDEPQIPTEEASLPNSEGNNARVAELTGRWTLRKKISNHQRLKKYVCSRCGYDSHWLSSLLDHERNEHGFISDEAPAYSCKSCHHMLPSPNSLSTHMATIHGLTIEDALHEAKISEATFPNSFKCAHCPAVFPTRSWGMAHVRHVHIRSRRDLAIKNSFVKNLFQCSSCSFRTHFAFRLQRHVKCRHLSSLKSCYRSTQLLHPSASVITPNSRSRKPSDVASLSRTPREDTTLVNTNAVYNSIAASLLSTPESDRKKAVTKSCDAESLLLPSYKLPLCGSPSDSPSFKLAIQTSASAVVGL